MRWPDLFFKSRKAKAVPEIVTVPPRAIDAPEPTKAETETNAAAKLEASKAEKEKAESLRALTESGSIRVPPRVVKDLPPASAPVEKPAEVDKSNTKTAVLPAVSRGSGVSLRQLAKLTDDARSLPKPEEAMPAPAVEIPPKSGAESSAKAPEPSAENNSSAPAAVVPAAFPIPVETGTVLETTTEKVVTDSPIPFEAKSDQPAATNTSPDKPASESSDAKHEALDSSSPPPRDTARVHVGHSTTSAPATAIESVNANTREKQEFVLANGERIIGHVLSETAQTIYLDHGTLGVLTLPRSQIATKPIEVILINGDRIVGDLIAETPECLYIKHASLGMLTVPHGQRSARVVEAILKDGDRILGEVLAETEDFTVIRSATLGTVAVQHGQVAMLNRKIEQMQLRSLPASAPAISDKPKD
jgi:RNase P/RNase MRP subunit p29